MAVVALVGTMKGGFLLRSRDRVDWSLDGPIFPGWQVTAGARPGGGDYLVAVASGVYGPALQRSPDLETWEQVVEGPAFPTGSTRKMQHIWTIVPVGDRVYAGVDEAGLFRSNDGGVTWQPVAGLNDHPSAEKWVPGAGGLAAHTLLADPADDRRMWCGISAAGVFRTEDGGDTWVPANEGVAIAAPDVDHPGIGYCVHGLAADPDDADLIYRQDHKGVYRTGDGGRSWERTEEGLPASFGFPIALDPHTKTLFVFPQQSDEYRFAPGGRMAVYRSADGAGTWQASTTGLPSEHAYTGVLRGAMTVDGLDPAGVYFGTTAGTVHVSVDRGDSWTTLPWILPRVLTVDVLDAG